MKRRSFLKGAAALFATPYLPAQALPAKAMAGISAASKAPIATAAVTAAHKSAVDVAYIWCRMFVEKNPNFELHTLTKQLGFSEKIVEEVLQRLVKNNIARPTLIKGIFEKIDSPIDFIDHTKLKSVSSAKTNFDIADDFEQIVEFLDLEEIRDEEMHEATFAEYAHQDDIQDYIIGPMPAYFPKEACAPLAMQQASFS